MREQKALQAEAKAGVEAQKREYEQFDFQNVYADISMENLAEDLTVNQQQADFERQSFQQTQANIMGNMRGAAGGSGIAGLAQSLAQQGQIASQRQSASIGQQEAQNQRAERAMAGQIQDKEREGDLLSRKMQTEQTGTLLGMAQQRTAAAANQVAAAKEAKWGAISGGIMGAAKMVPGFGEGLQGGGIIGESGQTGDSTNQAYYNSSGQRINASGQRIDENGNVIS